MSKMSMWICLFKIENQVTRLLGDHIGLM